jgi:hypothetical protein
MRAQPVDPIGVGAWTGNQDRRYAYGKTSQQHVSPQECSQHRTIVYPFLQPRAYRFQATGRRTQLPWRTGIRAQVAISDAKHTWSIRERFG